MTVTAVHEINRQKVRVEFDHQLTLVLYRGELKRYQLRAGMEVSDDLPEEIENQILKKRAVKYAMNLLIKRDYTTKELRDRLSRAGYTDHTVDHALQYVVSFGYVDDGKYARRYLETYKNRKSLRHMIGELKQKGVSEDILSLAVEEIEGMDEGEALRRCAEKKARSLDLNQDKDQQKFLRYLVGKGFSYGDAQNALKESRASQASEWS